MPHFIDIHEIQGVTADAVAAAHEKDVEVQDKYDVNYIKYWLNESGGKIFCLCRAPNAETAERVHREAHGLLAERIIEVDPDLADGFLGGGVLSRSGAVLLRNRAERDTGQRTIIFTDIVDSTAMTQRLGDRGAMVILERHDQIVREALSRTGGREVKHLGDGIMAAFVSPGDAVKCALLIQAELKGGITKARDQLVLRIGIASGQPVERNGDFFGSTVQLAARLCSHADPGHTLVSASVTEVCRQSGFAFEEIGPVSLKGFEQPVPAFAVAEVA
jgi:class 3 adenylate cyclase